MKILTIVGIGIICAVLLPLRATSADNADNNDYFAGDRNEELLQNVERFHLGPANFWDKYKAGRFQAAVEELNFVLRHYPNHPKALLLIGSIAKLTNTPSLATSYYARALHLFPQHALTYAQYGAYLVDIGKANAGIEKLKEAINMDQHLAPAYAWLAKAYSLSGNVPQARQAAEVAKELGYKGEIALGGAQKKGSE